MLLILPQLQHNLFFFLKPFLFLGEQLLFVVSQILIVILEAL